LTTYDGRYIPEFLRITGIIYKRDNFKPTKVMKEFYKNEKEALNKLSEREKRR